MNKPVDLDRGVEMFMKFHGLDPKHIGSMHVAALPSYAKRGGRMVNTKYASK
jgi:hypothetical protein